MPRKKFLGRDIRPAISGSHMAVGYYTGVNRDDPFRFINAFCLGGLALHRF